MLDAGYQEFNVPGSIGPSTLNFEPSTLNLILLTFGIFSKIDDPVVNAAEVD